MYLFIKIALTFPVKQHAMRYNLVLLSCIAIFITACNNSATTAGSTYTEDGFDVFNNNSLAKDISVLASDSFLGRKPFTEGEAKTIAYLQKRFSEVGLEPGNGNSYLQEVPMVNIATKADSLMEVQSPNGNFQLKGFDDYVMWTEKTDSMISLKNDEVVFAGYGVNAPERGWNDYAGLDVKGKIVMVLVNDPGYGIDSSLFKGDTMSPCKQSRILPCIYYRSDHFNFAKVGIPALYTGAGIDITGKGKEYGKKIKNEYNEKNYHRPSDEYTESWNLEGAIEDLKLLFMVGKRLAMEDKWPGWKEGSEFGQLRNKTTAIR